MSKRVYWASVGDSSRKTFTELLNVQPEPIIKDLMDKKSNPYYPEVAYQACPSAKSYFKNTYKMISPVSKRIQIDLAGSIIPSEHSNWFLPRPSYYANSIAFDFDLAWVFFCEDSLIMEQLPPHTHNVTASRYASLAAGAYDIGKWFRPIISSYTTWPGVSEFAIEENDPLFYLKFHTDEKIDFIKFEATQKIQEVATGATLFKNAIRFESLDSLYTRFSQSGRKKVLLREIKKEII